MMAGQHTVNSGEIIVGHDGSFKLTDCQSAHMCPCENGIKKAMNTRVGDLSVLQILQGCR
jgi:hypothetical protein